MKRFLLCASWAMLCSGVASSQTALNALAPEYGYSRAALERFQAMVRQTVRKSEAEKNYAIIVDKAAYRLFVLKDGKVLHEFVVELGKNPVSDKVQEGDFSTPEGFYRILYSQEGDQTRFYKALSIDYPNAADQNEFAGLLQRGALNEGATIGGQIQIHGLGSGLAGNDGGRNWTHGCVSLHNLDMDVLFPLVKGGGAPVTIVRFGAYQILHL